MTAPLLTCGLAPGDRSAVDVAGKQYARTVHHGETPDGLQGAVNGEAPALIFASTNAHAFEIAQACGAWRAHYPAAAIVCCAPGDDFVLKLEALEAGADQFLVSPIEEEALEFVLRFCLVEQGR